MSERIAYFDCFSGASGDMLLGALLAAGLSLDDLQADLAKLAVSGYELRSSLELRQGISGCKFDVLDTAHSQPARNWPAVREIISSSTLDEAVKARSCSVFECLARAEAQVHGTSIDEVHFHEVGAADSLVDIVGFCCAIQRLGIEHVYCSPLPLGSGRIQTAHGLLPVPAPATLAILASVGAPTIPFPGQGELLTPTGAALLAVLAEFRQPAMLVRGVGYGLGAKEFPWPNILRVWLGEPFVPAGLPQSLRDHEHERASPHNHQHG